MLAWASMQNRHRSIPHLHTIVKKKKNILTIFSRKCKPIVNSSVLEELNYITIEKME